MLLLAIYISIEVGTLQVCSVRKNLHSADQVDDENCNHLFCENQMKRDNYVSRKLKFSIMARHKEIMSHAFGNPVIMLFQAYFPCTKYQDTIC
jgi:hypothetical protein